MKVIKWTLFSAAVLLSVLQPVWAVTPAANSGIRSMPLTDNTTGTIERGGTITAVDRQGKTITVDGVTYPFATTSTHRNLQNNMQIRFSTIKDRISGQEKISEIWVTNSDGRPSHK